MKKKLFGGISVLAIVAVAAFNVNQNQKSDMSLLALANVEALANSEYGGNNCGRAVYEYDNDWYEDTKNFRRCGDCAWVQGTRPQYGCN